MKIEELNPDNFRRKAISNVLPTVVKFYDFNCPLCSGLASPFRRLAQKYVGQFRFYKYNIKDNYEFCEKYLDGGVPTLTVFLDTDNPILINYPEPEDPISGYSYEYLDKWLRHFLATYNVLKGMNND